MTNKDFRGPYGAFCDLRLHRCRLGKHLALLRRLLSSKLTSELADGTVLPAKGLGAGHKKNMHTTESLDDSLAVKRVRWWHIFLDRSCDAVSSDLEHNSHRNLK